MTDDRAWMDAALALARRGLGQVWPNPAVGCLIHRDGRVLGRGWTGAGGRPHAETLALAQAGAEARAATVHVTLEPCAHHGQTPPCADALVEARIARVVVAITDPDPRVAGRGLDRLRRAGIAVATGVLAERATALNRGFLTRVTAGRPMLTLKLAATLDGRIATSAGESRWITGEAARARVHLMRASHDAILIGAGTARADDPVLDVRLPGWSGRQPVRVVLDPALSLPPGSRLAATARQQSLWILHGAAADPARGEALAGTGALLVPMALTDGGLIDPVAALAELGARGLTRVLCEGGGRLAASLIRAGIADELVLFQAGLAIGAEGKPALGPLGLGRLTGAPRFSLIESAVIGGDVMTRWATPFAPHLPPAPG
jgi:diaminohydroxyphosphoribosylaminopyrimidine deaminase/5-amino-6-(5-phosphoribosylamino)uracil reductase